MSVPSSELGPTIPFPASDCVSTKGGRDQHSLAGEGVEGPNFGRLDRKLGTLFTLWNLIYRENLVFKITYNIGLSLCVMHYFIKG